MSKLEEIQYKIKMLKKSKMVQRQKCEVYSRVCGYMRPTSQWNVGKVQEFKDRKFFKMK